MRRMHIIPEVKRVLHTKEYAGAPLLLFAQASYAHVPAALSVNTKHSPPLCLLATFFFSQ